MSKRTIKKIETYISEKKNYKFHFITTIRTKKKKKNLKPKQINSHNIL